MINSTGSVNFTGRCPAIKTGQWASHCVNAFMPHESVTRYAPLVESTRVRTKMNPSYSGTFQLYPDNVLAIINKLRIMNEKIYDARETFVTTPLDGTYNYAVSAIKQLFSTRLGNCHENAKAAEAILRANGVKNPATAPLYMGGHPLDHVVCVFNRDGSKVKTIENNKTIIVDPWAGVVDFANNAMTKYKGIFKKLVVKDNDGKLTIPRITEHPMTPNDIRRFSENFPMFIQKKSPN